MVYGCINDWMRVMDNGWEQWKNHVLTSISRIENIVNEMNERCLTRPEKCIVGNSLNDIIKRINNIESELSALKVKYGLFSVLAGIISGSIATITSIIILLRKG